MRAAPDAETEQALAAASWEAHLSGRAEMDSAHLLLGLLHLPQSRAVRRLRALGVEPRWDRLRGPIADADAWPPLELASAEAETRGRETFGLEDLIIGLLREPSGLGGLLLRAHGLSLDKARRAFFEEAN